MTTTESYHQKIRGSLKKIVELCMTEDTATISLSQESAFMECILDNLTKEQLFEAGEDADRFVCWSMLGRHLISGTYGIAVERGQDANRPPLIFVTDARWLFCRCA